MVDDPPSDEAVNEWARVRDGADDEVQALTSELVSQRSAALADVFYAHLLADPRSAGMLDHQVVDSRLHASTARWLRQLFDPATPLAQLHRTQRITGEVHARIGMPVALVSLGARVLKHEICAGLVASPLSRAALVAATQYVHEMFAIAIDAMANAFSSNTSRMVRSEEAYRLYFLGQDMKAERERRRSELMEWVKAVLDRYYWDDQPGAEPWVGHSPFGLWMQHKASILFDGAPEVATIRAAIAQIEQDLLPRLRQVRANHADARTIVQALNEHIDGVKTLLGTLFDRYIAVEDGRDPITALLNRRYFPVVARREIELARSHGTGFAVLMIDLDGLRRVCDAGGLDAGNLVLNQTAARLQDSVRAGDFVFRIGDDEFLVLLVEVAPAAAAAVAEGLRQRFERQPFTLAAAQAATLTVSVGVAMFDGHPDYQRLVDRADEALRRAKQAGRNRCVMAD